MRLTTPSVKNFFSLFLQRSRHALVMQGKKAPYLFWTSLDTVAPIKDMTEYAGIHLLKAQFEVSAGGRALRDAPIHVYSEMLLKQKQKILERLNQISKTNYSLRADLLRAAAKTDCFLSHFDSAKDFLNVSLIDESSKQDEELRRVQYQNGLTYLGFGMLTQAQADYDHALDFFKMAREKITSLFGYYNPAMMESTYYQYMCALLTVHEYKAAEDILQLMITGAQHVFPKLPSKHKWLSSNLGCVYAEQNQVKKALEQWESSILNVDDTTHIEKAVAHYNSAALLDRVNDLHTRDAHLKIAMATFHNELDDEHPLHKLTHDMLPSSNDSHQLSSAI